MLEDNPVYPFDYSVLLAVYTRDKLESVWFSGSAAHKAFSLQIRLVWTERSNPLYDYVGFASIVL